MDTRSQADTHQLSASQPTAVGSAAVSAESAHHFAATRWTLIQRAVQPDQATSSKALSEIVHLYWQPLYAYSRCRGSSPEDAADLTQGFFLALMEKSLLQTADPSKGRLRSFLITLFRRYSNDELDKTKTWKRGGRATLLSLDFTQGERHFQAADADRLTPEALYDRNWAIAVTNEAMRRLSEERRQAGKGQIFEQLRPHLAEPDDTRSGALKEAAAQLSMEESSLRVALFRMRKRFRDFLLEVVAETLGTTDEGEIRQELEALCHAMP